MKFEVRTSSDTLLGVIELETLHDLCCWVDRSYDGRAVMVAPRNVGTWDEPFVLEIYDGNPPRSGEGGK